MPSVAKLYFFVKTVVFLFDEIFVDTKTFNKVLPLPNRSEAKEIFRLLPIKIG